MSKKLEKYEFVRLSSLTCVKCGDVVQALMPEEGSLTEYPAFKLCENPQCGAVEQIGVGIIPFVTEYLEPELA